MRIADSQWLRAVFLVHYIKIFPFILYSFIILLPKYIINLSVPFKIQKMFRKESSTSQSVIKKLSKHQIFFKLFVCFSQNAHFNTNKPKNLCSEDHDIPNRVQPKSIKLVFAAFQLSTHYYGVRTKNCWLRFRRMCLSLPIVTCIHGFCCRN